MRSSFCRSRQGVAEGDDKATPREFPDAGSEATILGYIWYILGSYWDHGKEHGNYYLGFRVHFQKLRNSGNQLQA